MKFDPVKKEVLSSRYSEAAGKQLSDYLLMLKTHAGLEETIRNERKSFAEKYDSPSALKSTAGLTLLSFKQYALCEQAVMSRVRQVCRSLSPVLVELAGFASLPSHTIYFNTATREPLMELSKAFRPLKPLITTDKNNKPHFIDYPHITLARELLPWQYERSWQEYAERGFSARFVANELLLMKRAQGGSFKKLADFRISRDAPASSAQTSLFSIERDVSSS